MIHCEICEVEITPGSSNGPVLFPGMICCTKCSVTVLQGDPVRFRIAGETHELKMKPRLDRFSPIEFELVTKVDS